MSNRKNSKGIEVLDKLIDTTSDLIFYAENENIEEVSSLVEEREILIQLALKYKNEIQLFQKFYKDNANKKLLKLQQEEEKLKIVFEKWNSKVSKNLKEANRKKLASNYIIQKNLNKGIQI